MKARFDTVCLKAIATVVPPKIIDIDTELDSIYKGDTKALARIKKVIGLQTRHIAEPHITASDMGAAAAKKVLESTHTNAKQIDALIVVTQTPDFILPATACYLHGRLGLPTSCLSFDINQACAGYLYGLYIAHSLIESRAAHKVLLIVGDTLSRYVNPLDSNLAPIIGDGASATLLESSHLQNAKESKGRQMQEMGFVSGFGQNDILDSIFMESSQDKYINKSAFFELGTQGEKFYQLIIPEGASRIPTREIIPESKVWETGDTRTLKQLYMDGAEIFNFAVMQYPKSFEEILRFSGETKEGLDYCFFHQANKYIVDNITRTLALPKDKVPNGTTSKYGNLSGCSVPATICDTLGALASAEGINEVVKVAAQKASEDVKVVAQNTQNALKAQNVLSEQKIPNIKGVLSTQNALNAQDKADADYHILHQPLRVHLAGFGAGLSWGNAIVTLDRGFIAHKVSIYES